MDNLLEIAEMSFTYPGQKTPTLREVTFSVERGAFVTLCGPSGCGKSTLLRHLKSVLAPQGERMGTIRFEGRDLDQWDQREQSQRIGFVMQSPENQVVTDKVWHELAFGLESLGYDTAVIQRRVAEMASFFDIQDWFYKDVSELSGGQKQLLNLASIMVMQPDILILDEPTSQLDPIAASDFLLTVGRINREFGTTVLLTEHRLEEAFPMSSRVLVMDHGTLICDGMPAQVGQQLRSQGHAMFLAMPTAMRVWAAVPNEAPCPVTVREGKDWLHGFAEEHALQPLPKEVEHPHGEASVIGAEDLWFRYEREEADIVKGFSLEAKQGELVALLGGNGAGKSTSLKLLAGLLKPYRGKVWHKGRMGVLPQNPQALFVKKTVLEDLFEILKDTGMTREEQEERISYMVKLCRLEELLDRHPYDLSGGEQQRAALAKVLLLSPDLLLMDEPTKGLDAEFKQIFAQVLEQLLGDGMTVVMVSHDVEFCARYAHRCALFFDGKLVAQDKPRAFFSGNHFYTTAANRMARGLVTQAVTSEDVIAICGGSQPQDPEVPKDYGPLPKQEEKTAAEEKKKFPWWRKLIAGAAILTAAAALLQSLGIVELAALFGKVGTLLIGSKRKQIFTFAVSLLVLAFATARRTAPKKDLGQVPRESRKLPRRTVVTSAMVLLMIPLTLFVSCYYLENKRYNLTSFLVLMECMLPFFLSFEGRKPQARELVVIAVLSAVGVAGRAALFMFPQFKPVMAVTIIAGVALGGETGFLVGAMSMLVSNMMFSQGPWTPWQMFCMGLVGFLAGVLYRRGWLRRTRGSLCVFGALAALCVYGGIINATSLLMWTYEWDWKMLSAYYISGFPMDCVHAAATFVFLWFGGEPMLEKLDRVKTKYHLIEERL